MGDKLCTEGTKLAGSLRRSQRSKNPLGFGPGPKHQLEVQICSRPRVVFSWSARRDPRSDMMCSIGPEGLLQNGNIQEKDLLKTRFIFPESAVLRIPVVLNLPPCQGDTVPIDQRVRGGASLGVGWIMVVIFQWNGGRVKCVVVRRPAARPRRWLGTADWINSA